MSLKDSRMFNLLKDLLRRARLKRPLAISVMDDMGERKKTERALREKNAYLTQAQAVANVGSWNLDIHRNELNWSEQTYRIFNVPSSTKLTYEFFLERVHPDDRKYVDEKWQAALRGEPYDIEHRILVDGAVKWVREKAELDFDDQHELHGGIGIVQDITERKRVEDDLKAAKEAADAANKAKSQFLAMISHEIRTPLGIVLGFTDLVLSGDVSPDEAKSYVTSVKRNGDLLLNIIDNLLDLSKIESGRFEVAPVDIDPRALIKEVEDMLRLHAVERGLAFEIKFTTEIPGLISTDPVRFKQILVNVIGNAVKFTEKGGVVIEVKAVNGGAGEFLEVLVGDTGRGMTAAQTEQLFEPFMQADLSTTRQFGGTGLGLSLARRFARALGGDVILDSTDPSKGSTFRITIATGNKQNSNQSREAFYAGDKSTTATNEIELGAIDLKNIRALVVDDSVENQILLSRYLKRAGAWVEVARNGEEALAKADGSHDIILMDISMPVMDGYEAVRRLRERQYVRPIVALTAHAMKEDRERALKNGFNDHIAKPVNRDSLLRKVSAVLSSMR